MTRPGDETAGTGARPSVSVTRTGAVVIVSIDRPAVRNAVDSATATALVEAFAAFDEDPSASVAVLTGRDGNFCAGADLKAVATGDRRPVRDAGPGPMGPTRMTLDKPVIAAVEGYAVAGGLELALWCDLRVAAETATFGVFCRRFGVPLVDLGTVRLPRLIGHSRAMDLILTGRAVGGKEACEIGLANRLCPHGTALSTALALAEQLAALPQLCLRGDRRSALQQWGLSEQDAAINEARIGRSVIESGETAQGAARFAAGEGRGGVAL
jgi:enoyl-CoA hydratase